MLNCRLHCLKLTLTVGASVRNQPKSNISGQISLFSSNLFTFLFVSKKSSRLTIFKGTNLGLMKLLEDVSVLTTSLASTARSTDTELVRDTSVLI